MCWAQFSDLQLSWDPLRGSCRTGKVTTGPSVPFSSTVNCAGVQVNKHSHCSGTRIIARVRSLSGLCSPIAWMACWKAESLKIRSGERTVLVLPYKSLVYTDIYIYILYIIIYIIYTDIDSIYCKIGGRPFQYFHRCSLQSEVHQSYCRHGRRRACDWYMWK